jgi:hypothetical protein
VKFTEERSFSTCWNGQTNKLEGKGGFLEENFNKGGKPDAQKKVILN